MRKHKKPLRISISEWSKRGATKKTHFEISLISHSCDLFIPFYGFIFFVFAFISLFVLQQHILQVCIQICKILLLSYLNLDYRRIKTMYFLYHFICSAAITILRHGTVRKLLKHNERNEEKRNACKTFIKTLSSAQMNEWMSEKSFMCRIESTPSRNCQPVYCFDGKLTFSFSSSS